MPITPYTQPVSFEYKPLGLQAFAEPLAKMQEGYDKANDILATTKYDLTSLQHDSKRKAELEKQLDDEKLRISEGLLKNKNSKEAVRGIMSLNNISKSHPEIQALQSNLAAHQEFVKEEKAKLDKGYIGEEEFRMNVANALKKHELQGGTKYDRETGDYNVYSGKGLGRNLRPEMDKQLSELTKLTKADKVAYATRAGIDPSRYTRLNRETHREEIDYNELHNILAGTITSNPEFINSISERKNLELDYLKYHNQDQYNKIIGDKYQNEIERISNYHQNAIEKAKQGDKASKDYLNSDSYIQSKNKLDELIGVVQSGDKDIIENQGRNMIVNGHLKNYVEETVRPYAMAGSYKDVSDKITETNMNKSQLADMGIGTETPKAPSTTWTPDEFSPEFTTTSLDDKSKDVKSVMTGNFNDLNLKTKGALANLLPYGHEKGKFNLHDQSKQLNKILNSYNNVQGSSYEKFKADFIKNGGSNVNEKALKGVYFSLKNHPDVEASLQKTAYDMNQQSVELKTTEGIRKTAYENLSNSDEYKKEAAVLYDNEAYQVNPSAKLKLDENGKPIFKNKNEEIIYKAMKADKDRNGYITANQYAKAAGFNSAEEFVKAGRKFPTQDNLSINGAYSASANLAKINDLQKKHIDKDLRSKSFITSFHITGNTKEDSALKAQTINELDAIVGANGENIGGLVNPYGKGMAGQTGFDEKGNWVGKKNGKPFPAQDSYGNILIAIPVKVKDPNDSSRTINKIIYTKPKKGTVLTSKMNDMFRTMYNSSGDDVDRAEASKGLFNLNNPGNPLNNYYVESLEVSKEQPQDVYRFVGPNQNTYKIIKKSEKGQSQSYKGDDSDYYKISYLTNGTWNELPTKYKDIDSVKEELGVMYAQ